MSVASLKKSHTLSSLQKFIDSYAIVVFAKSYCHYSQLAKKAMEAHDDLFGDYAKNKRLIIIDIDVLFSSGEKMQELQNDLATLTGASTVPRIFAFQSKSTSSSDKPHSSFLGGGSEISTLQIQGKLRAILQNAIELFENKTTKATKSSSSTKSKPSSKVSNSSSSSKPITRSKSKKTAIKKL
jgi:hypothetical protein